MVFRDGIEQRRGGFVEQKVYIAWVKNTLAWEIVSGEIIGNTASTKHWCRATMPLIKDSYAI
jgi:hypothetical protein